MYGMSDVPHVSMKFLILIRSIVNTKTRVLLFTDLRQSLGMGISDDEMAQIKDIMSNANASYTQLRMDGTLATNESLLNIMAYPTTYVVGSDGTILDTIEGSKDYEGWKALIDSYLAE